MVGPGEVDDELEPETAEECTKYGSVVKVLIFEVCTVQYYHCLTVFVLSDKTYSPNTTFNWIF